MSTPPRRINPPETRRWVRIIDTTLVLLMWIGLVVFYFYLPPASPRLLGYVVILAMACLPVIAWTLWRPSDLGRMERIALFCVLLALGLALLIAGVESTA